MKYKEQRTKNELMRQEGKAKSKAADKDYKVKIREHRMRYFGAAAAVILLTVAVSVILYVRIKNRIYTDYEIRNSVSREMITGTTVLNLDGAILTYSKDAYNSTKPYY